MAENQFLTVQDVYKPIETAQAVQNLDDSVIRNRIDTMKMKQLYQEQKQRYQQNNPYIIPGHEGEMWHPGMNQFIPIPRKMGGQQPSTSQFVPGNTQNPEMASPNLNVQGSGAPLPSTANAQPQTASQGVPTAMIEDQKSLRQVQTISTAVSRRLQELEPQLSKSQEARDRYNKLNNVLDNNPHVQKFKKDNGYDSISTRVDDNGYKITTFTKDMSTEALQNMVNNEANGEIIIPYVDQPGKYKISINENNGYIKSIESVKYDSGILTDKELNSNQRVLRGVLREQLGREPSMTELYQAEQTEKQNLLDKSSKSRQNAYNNRVQHFYDVKTGQTVPMRSGNAVDYNAKSKEGNRFLDMSDPTIKSNVAALQTDVKKYDLMKQSESKAFADSRLLQESSRNYQRGKIKMVNSWEALSRGSTNDPKLADLQMKLMAFGREFYKVVNNAYASASELTQGAQAKADEMLSTSDSWESLNAKIKAAQQEMINTKTTFKKVIDDRRKNLQGMTLTSGEDITKEEIGAMSDEQLLQMLNEGGR